VADAGDQQSSSNAYNIYDEDDDFYEINPTLAAFHIVVDRTSQLFADDVFQLYDRTPIDRIYNRPIKVTFSPVRLFRQKRMIERYN
jgi:hypothetical protein